MELPKRVFYWSLLVLSLAERTFFRLDSMGTWNISATSKIVEILKITLECPMAPLITIESLQQNNSYNCGIVMIANVELICEFYLATAFFLNAGNGITKKSVLRRVETSLPRYAELNWHACSICGCTREIEIIISFEKANHQRVGKNQKGDAEKDFDRRT